MQYIVFRKKKTCQSILNFIWKKDIQIILEFFCHMQKNILFLFFILLFGKNPFFLETRLPKISLKGVCQTHS
jgi:hypothetical protein